MNPNCPSPDDDTPTVGSTPIERQLKRLRPRPAPFDAASVFAAARTSTLADRTSALATCTVREPSRPSRPWLTIATAFASGAVAGALLACLVLIGGRDSTSATGKNTTHAIASSAPEVTKDATMPKIEPNAPHEDRPAKVPWSAPSVATHLLEMREPRLSGQPPLRAGDSVLYRTFFVSGPVAQTVDKPERLSGPSGTIESTAETTSTRSIDRERLLVELLGIPDARL